MLSYEEARLFIEKISCRGSVLGLENMYALMERLGNPQDDIPVIHIAGTNGKGSVGAYIASICKEAGLRVGRFCSPAVFDPLECWQYNGRNMTKEEYADTLEKVKRVCDMLDLDSKNPVRPTVFEIETAMAFVYFKEKQVDVLLLETGLGGKTDATNIVKHPMACVFTTISRDHMQFLGETLTEIAAVKAGIIKSGALVFSAEQNPEVKAVLDQKISKMGCVEAETPRITYVQGEQLQMLSQKPGALQFSYKGKMYQTSMAGNYQMKNAALAIEVAEMILRDRGISEEHKKNGVGKTTWPGRFEVIGQEPLFIIDGAHNEDAVKQLALTIEKSFTNPSIDFIIGILADKEHEKMLEIMMPYANRIFTVTPPNPRGLDGRILAEEVRKWHEDVVYCKTIEEAVKEAISHSKETGCLILAFGSLSYLGELKETYKQICESRIRNV